MEIRPYLASLLKRWWLIILLALAGGTLAYVLTPKPEPLYEAVTTVLINQGEDPLPDANAISTGQRLANTLAELMQTRSLLSTVIVNLDIDRTPDALAERINVLLIPSTNMLQVSVKDTDRQLAADIANEIIRVYVQQYQLLQSNRFMVSKENLQDDIDEVLIDLEANQQLFYQLEVEINSVNAQITSLNNLEQREGLTTGQIFEREQLRNELAGNLFEQNRLRSSIDQLNAHYNALLASQEEIRLLEAQDSNIITVLEVALPGTLVTGPSRKVVNGIQGAVGGTVISLGLIALLEYLRTTVNSSEEVERLTGLLTLGIISDMGGRRQADKLVTALQPRSPSAEAYRVLRANIEFSENGEAMRTLLVTSSSPVEGKSTTAANLAISMAQAGKRVILVDSDLRRPTLHKLFRQSNSRGVTTALLQDDNSSVSDHLLATEIEGLYLMPSGPLPPNPADILGSKRMARLVQILSESAEVVIFDSPPSLVVADANLLARLCDGTILVLLAETTSVDLVRKTRNQITQAGANLLGVVLNRVSRSRNGQYYQYYGA